MKIFPPDRFQELLRFNFLPTLDIDSSWWQDEWLRGVLPPSKFPDCAQFHLSQFFLKQIDLVDQFDFDFSTKEKQIALLPAKHLQRLVYLTGLTFLSQRIARAILSTDRQAIKNAISETDYFFAIKQGVRLLKEANFEVHPFTDSSDNFNDLNAKCYQAGMANIATVMNGFSPAFVRRLQLKFPKDRVEKCWKACDSDRDAHMQFLLKLEKQVNQT